MNTPTSRRQRLQLAHPCRLALAFALAATTLVLSACITDVSLTGIARCDGLLQASEETVDSPFDADSDGFFDRANSGCADAYDAADLDCDDGNASIHPGAAEIECNGIDDDCDPASADGYDADSDGVLACDDCDDQDENNFPGNLEACDGLDNDCDGEIEVDGADEDGDGWRVCAGDCDDSRAEAYEGAAELCNGLDDDCNELADFDAAGEADADADGSLSCEDCDDDPSSGAANTPGADELCDGEDNDCNAGADFDAAGEVDADADGSLSCEDCDDDPATGAANTPGAAELCDGEDNDCIAGADFDSDGEVDADADGSLSCEDCDDDPSTGAANTPGAAELCDGIDNDCTAGADYDSAGELDADGDGYRTCEGDCDDSVATGAARTPGAAEICDGIDNDCDSIVPASETDNDGDQYVECIWVGSSSSVLGGNDCDDSPATGFYSFPGNPEICGDGLDNDCNGTVDDGCPGPPSSYSGTWIVSPTISYSCFLGLVTLNVSAVTIVDANPSILVSGLMITPSAIGPLSGTFSSATDFSASNFIGGACDETYTITGSFTSASSFTAVLTADYFSQLAGGCGDSTVSPECTNQSWNITGVR